MTGKMKKVIVRAIRAGGVVFAEPEAAECMPTKAGPLPRVTAVGFKYARMKPTKTGFVLSWGFPGIGFGELSFWRSKAGWHADTEGMGPDFCAAAMEAWVRSVVVVREKA